MTHHKSQEHPPVSIRTAADPHLTADAKWEQIIMELRACSDMRADGWDDLAVARYLSGECSASELEQIEQAIGQSPGLGACIVLAQQSLGDIESAA